MCLCAVSLHLCRGIEDSHVLCFFPLNIYMTTDNDVSFFLLIGVWFLVVLKNVYLDEKRVNILLYQFWYNVSSLEMYVVSKWVVLAGRNKAYHISLLYLDFKGMILTMSNITGESFQHETAKCCFSTKVIYSLAMCVFFLWHIYQHSIRWFSL